MAPYPITRSFEASELTAAERVANVLRD